MRSKKSAIAELTWNAPLSSLLKSSRSTPTVTKLMEGGVGKIYDLLWILPLRIYKTPTPSLFSEANLNQYFLGSGKVIHRDIRPTFGRRTKGRFLLYNGFLVVKDDISSETISLRWFNLYSNQKKQLETLESVQFLGQVQEYKGQKQIINPQLLQLTEELSDYIIEYPTINKVSGNYIKKFINSIPAYLWDQIPELLPELNYDQGLKLREAFKVMHGKWPIQDFTPQIKKIAEERIVYEEFLEDQLKIRTRRNFIKFKEAPKILIASERKKWFFQHLPFGLTAGQQQALEDIERDFQSGHPMMRMLQGDVGCGKTIVALLAAQFVIDQQHQVGLMCPTEALAQQHFETISILNPHLRVGLLLGSLKAKERKSLLAQIESGQIDFVIGTHALFQDSVKFKNLAFAIIDEQHKFGVEQRLKLVAKGKGVHCLIMSATPIPRTLSLAQYGDLDITLIKTMPQGRIPIKTRITEKVNYEKYIDFIKARLSMGEQAYFVFPAIEESEVIAIQNVQEGLLRYQKIFYQFHVASLHGQMRPEEKEEVIRKFKDNKIHILISTSVIEVGINIPNATIMSIYNPERFGLSSLHQLRGRVGRGGKPGFCFLVLNEIVPTETMERLQVIENHLDGFIIAEKDLVFRGEGDLFGVNQSGIRGTRRLANIVMHSHILEKVARDISQLEHTHPEFLAPHFERLAKDQKILDTI